MTIRVCNHFPMEWYKNRLLSHRGSYAAGVVQGRYKNPLQGCPGRSPFPGECKLYQYPEVLSPGALPSLPLPRHKGEWSILSLRVPEAVCITRDARSELS